MNAETNKVKIYPASNGYFVADEVLDALGFEGPLLSLEEAEQAAEIIAEKFGAMPLAKRARLSAKIGKGSEHPKEVGH